MDVEKRQYQYQPKKYYHYKKKVLKCEVENRKKLKKSLVANEDISKGIKIKNHLITAKRPGFGILPSKISEIIGLKAKKNIKKNTVLKKNMFFKKWKY